MDAHSCSLVGDNATHPPVMPTKMYKSVVSDTEIHSDLLIDTRSFFSFTHDGTVVTNA